MGTFLRWRSAFPLLCCIAFTFVASSARADITIRTAPPLPPPSGTVVHVSSVDALVRAVDTLTSNTTILIAPGVYTMTRELRIRNGVRHVALRGATGRRDDVVIRGSGMRVSGINFGLKVENAQDVLIADLSIGDAFWHPIQLQGEAGATRVHIYNVRLFDAGQQFLKVTADESRGLGVNDSIVEYSLFEYTTIGPDNGYTQGIDAFFAANMTIRYNTFRNFRVPAGAAYVNRPAILMWRGSRGTVTHSNTFINCERGIIYGLGPDGSGRPSHSGGLIYNNFIYRDDPVHADAGISLWDSPGTRVFHNTVIQSGTYRDAIEYRFPGTTGVEIVNNLTDGAIRARDGAQAFLTGNFTTAQPHMFVNAPGADLRLAGPVAQVVDQGVSFPGLTSDWGGKSRPAGGGWDIGADEFHTAAAPPPPPPTSPLPGTSARFVEVDRSTQGDWKGRYGRDGYRIASDGMVDPPNAQVRVDGAAAWTWSASTSDSRALQKVQDSSRIAATWYSGNAFTIDIEVGNQQRHVALYAIDWDHGRRVQTIEVLDGYSGALLDTRQLAEFSGGQYLVWEVRGSVRFRIRTDAGPNAVVSGIFFDGEAPSSSAANARFLGIDSSTRGDWTSAYGRLGYALAGGAINLPPSTAMRTSDALSFIWAHATSDTRALQQPNWNWRMAATWYASDAFSVTLTPTDARPYQLALYAVDWDRNGRVQVIEIVDAATGAVLDSQSIQWFSGGQYVVWRVEGAVHVRVRRTAGPNAVISGVFFDPF